MSARVLIRLQEARLPGQPPLLLGTLLEAPPMVASITNTALPVVVDPDAVLGATPAGAGAQVLAALRGHADVAGALGAIVALPVGQRVPIGLEILAASSSALPWEAMFDPGARFLALDDRWPIFRTTRLAAGRIAIPKLAPPLRLCAVLSAAGRTALPEWEALRDAVGRARQLGLAVEVVVITGEQAVRDAVLAAAAAGDAALRAEALPASADELLLAIEAARPRLLHVFAHGDVAAGQPRIHLATAADHAAGHPRGSVSLGPPQLRPLVDRGLWLVTLSVCESAAPGGESHGLAYDLVDAGLPAALGMRRPVDAGVAGACCAGFYAEVLRQFAEIAARPPGTHAVDWPRALRPARQRIVDLDPAHDPEAVDDWTVPVLFVRPEGFQVVTEPAPAVAAVNAALGERDVAEAFLDLMADAEAPAALLDEAATLAGEEP